MNFVYNINFIFKLSSSNVITTLSGTSYANTTDKAFTANSIYESLDSVYYIETSENSSAGLVKFDYTKLLQGGISKGKTLISADCKGYAIYSIVGDYMYLADTATGNYYRCNYKSLSFVFFLFSFYFIIWICNCFIFKK